MAQHEDVMAQHEDRSRELDQDRYRELVEQVREYAIFRIDCDGRACTWNEGVRNVLGYDEAEFLGFNVAHLFTPEDRATGVVEREFLEARATGSANNDRWMLRKDGTRVWIAGRTSPIRTDTGDLLGYSKVMRDHTALRKAIDSLVATEAGVEIQRSRLTAVIEQMPAGVIVAEAPSGRIIVGNRQVARIWRHDLIVAEDVEEYRAYRGFHPDGRPYRSDEWPLVRAIATGELTEHEEIRFQRGDDTWGWLRVSAAPIREADGRIVAGVMTFSDVTELRLAEERLHQAQRIDAVGRLAGGIAHDLNNMLMTVIGHADFLARDLGPEDARRADVDQIRHAAERSAMLTAQLLAFARRDVVQPRALDLNAVVRQSERLVRPVVGESIDLVVQLSPEAGVIHADPSRVEQIILNLVLNARDAMPRGGRLTIETASVDFIGEDYERDADCSVSPGRYTQLAVADTGQGMDAETLARIWEPFFTTKPVGQGTGLGLAMVHGAVAQACGFVRASSEPGQGTTVRAYWPQLPKTSAPVRTEERAPAVARGREKVLVVEDEGIVRNIVMRALSAYGYHCVEAGTGQEALRLIESPDFAVDLMLTDVVMPGIAGGELGRRLASVRPGVPVLYISGFTDEEVVRRGLLETRTDTPFLQKPFSPATLLEKVREVLDRVGTSGPKA
ncbi:MAG: PAS domain S-box protein [Gemmatimonadales bacterium]|nr:PAS domain S-box protein [Gemmatimonadales bacterium]